MTLSTGMKGLDTILDGGFKPGQLITVSGLPGIGKTSLVFQWMHNICAQNAEHHIFFTTFEMPAHEVSGRLLALSTNLSHSDMLSGDINDEEWMQIADTLPNIEHWKVWIASDLSTVDEYIQRAREQHKKHPLSLAIVDYLHMMYASEEAKLHIEHTVAHRSQMSLKLKNLAHELQIPVVVVAPFTRDIIEKETTVPTLNALRGSGMLGAYSDVVIFLNHRAECPPMDKGFVMNMRVIKRREGVDEDVPVFFVPELTKFSTIEVG